MPTILCSLHAFSTEIDEWLIGDTVLAIQKWRSHELEWRLGYRDDIEERANPATSKAGILRDDALTMHGLWNEYLDCCIIDGNLSRPDKMPEYEDLSQLLSCKCPRWQCPEIAPKGQVTGHVQDTSGTRPGHGMLWAH